jgi:hypothetical protein
VVRFLVGIAETKGVDVAAKVAGRGWADGRAFVVFLEAPLGVPDEARGECDS